MATERSKSRARGRRVRIEDERPLFPVSSVEMGRPTVAMATALMALALTRTARADNTEPFFYSDDAAMTGGTVVAATRDAGAIWYNPAGLGGIRRGQIDLNGSAFGIRIRNVRDALRTNLPSGYRSVDLECSDIFSAPHAIALVRHLSDTVTAGFGFYVTSRDVRTAESQVDVNDVSIANPAETARYRQRLDLSVDETRYHFGPAIGWEMTPGLRVGLSIFGTYGKQTGFAQYTLAAEASGELGSSILVALAQTRYAFSYFGLQPQGGLQWDFAEGWSLGLLMRGPEMLLSASPNGVNLQTSTVVAPGRAPEATFVLDKPTADAPPFTIVSPLRIATGISRRFGPSTWIAAEVDIQAPFVNENYEQTTVVNGRVGARFKLTEKLGAGFGLFTDRAREPRLGADFTDELVDAYGIAGGIEIRTPLSLSERPDPEALVLSTTLAMKYAIGFGSMRAADLDLVNAGTVPPRQVDVVYHTILPYIGSGILF